MTTPHFQPEKEAVTYLQGGPRDYTIKPRELNIVWGNDERYWRVPKKPEDDGPAELMQVCWLEVTGAVDIIAGKEYEINFKVELAPDAFGWRDIQPLLMAKVGKKGKYNWTIVQLAQEQNEPTKTFTIPDNSGQPFRINCSAPANESSDNTLYFGLYEVWSGKWKGGLRIYEVNVKQVTAGT